MSRRFPDPKNEGTERAFAKHTMLGPGGVLKTPKSESQQIWKALQLLKYIDSTGMDDDSVKRLSAVQDILTDLMFQVSKGYHRNPQGKFNAGVVIGRMGDDVHDVRYRHAENGKNYEHEFNGDVLVYAVERNGKRDLLLTHKRGDPLWDDF